ncbi:MAG: class I SAM-dependent methyltransferase [Bacillota bacterium]|nr:class I SAM-dependent methyltransferase [Bacillota bacterium]
MPDSDELAFWEKRWRDYLADPEQNTATKWDWSPTDDAVLEALLAAAGPDIAGLRILEVGSGTAKVSSCLAKKGARVTMVDAAPSALTLGRRLFHSLGLTGEFVQADMASLPFESAAFDLVWNSGVIRLVKPGGHFVTINPNARCLLYRVTMYHAAQSGGAGILEVPAVSLREELSRLGLEVTAEYPAAFVSSTIFFAGLPGAAPLARLIAEWYGQLPPEERAFFPGYLLVTVGRQPGGP